MATSARESSYPQGREISVSRCFQLVYEYSGAACNSPRSEQDADIPHSLPWTAGVYGIAATYGGQFMPQVEFTAFGNPYSVPFGFEQIQRACRRHGIHKRDRVFTHEKTVWLWLAQIIAGGQSCSDAVARMSLYQRARGRAISASTGAYCQARKRIKSQVIRDLVRETARALERECDEHWIIDRPAWAVDGTGIVLQDTEAIREQFPKTKQLADGTGMPQARVLFVNSIATGAILTAEIGASLGKGTGENSLLRETWTSLRPEDVLVGDRLYQGYESMTLLALQQVATVFRRNKQLRTAGTPTKQRIARNDRIVEMLRGFRTRRALPDNMRQLVPWKHDMRLSRYVVDVCNSREEDKDVRLVSTLTSPRYTLSDLATLYEARWNVELDIRSFKHDLGGAMLKCKTPEMLEKELLMLALANNVVRCLAAMAARRANCAAREISFRETMRYMDRYSSKLDLSDSVEQGRLFHHMLDQISEHRVGDRPGRYEPRAWKYRGSPKPYMQTPRHEARARKLYQGDDKGKKHRSQNPKRRRGQKPGTH